MFDFPTLQNKENLGLLITEHRYHLTFDSLFLSLSYFILILSSDDALKIHHSSFMSTGAVIRHGFH